MASEKCSSARDLPASGKRRFIANPSPPISNLGDDLLIEILIRSFPNPKSGCRGKLVCKRWNSLIAGPCFNRRFVSHHQTSRNEGEPPPMLFSYSRDHVFNFLHVPDEVSRRWYFRFHVFDSFKDLILCGYEELIGSTGPLFSGELVRSFFVCNPFTEQWVALPLAPEKSTGTRSFARLVCEPRSSYNLDLGDGKSFVYSEYRFRVVCLYQHSTSIKLDVFCSESRKWTKEALVLDGHLLMHKNLISCNRELFWCSVCTGTGTPRIVLASVNPFRLDIPPTCFRIKRSEWNWNISVSQGAFYLVVLKGLTFPAVLYVSRLEEDHRTWVRQYEWLLLKPTTTSRVNYEVKDFVVLGLHPGKPEIVFLLHHGLDGANILFFNLRSQEVGFFDKPQANWMVFQPTMSCWPTPIPNYEKLQGMYDGSYNCWDQQISKSITALSLSTVEECQLVVGQFGHRRKDNNRSAISHYRQRHSDIHFLRAVAELRNVADIDDELNMDACVMFKDNDDKVGAFLALDERMRKKWLLRELRRNGSG